MAKLRIYKGEFEILLSAALQKELEPAPEKIVKLVTGLSKLPRGKPSSI